MKPNAKQAATAVGSTFIKPKSIRKSQSSRAGIIFPVSRVQRRLKNLPQTDRISKGAGVYLASVIEYLIAEIAELAGNVCRDDRHVRITPRHIMLAVSLDEELNQLLKKVIIPGAGVLPQIVANLPNKIQNNNTNNTLPTPVNKASTKTVVPILDPVIPKIKKIPSKKIEKNSKNVTVLSERSLPSGQKLTVVQADITNVATDAIVHPTNNTFYLGGEVGSAIARAGGQSVRDIVNKLHTTHGGLPVCGVALSEASEQMLSKNIIHVYSPAWDYNKQDEKIDDLKKVVENIFTLSETNKLKSIALPSISSGANGFPKQLAAQTILRSINSYFKTNQKSNIEQVFFVLYDSESVGIYTSELGKLEI